MKLHISNMNMTTFKPFLLLISLLALALVSSSVPIRFLSKREIAPTPGVLFLDVKTGYPGTTSNVSITLYDYDGNNLTIPNLADWDDNVETPAGHVYFQTGQVDKLIGAMVNRNVFTSEICCMNVTLTWTGSSPDWGLEYIWVRSTAIGRATFAIGEKLHHYNNYNVPRTLFPPPKKGIMTGCTIGSLPI